MDIIGLRVNTKYGTKKFSSQKELQDFEQDVFEIRIVAIVIFFLLSIVLSEYFKVKLKAATEEDNFVEEDYKKLFEFTDPKSKLKIYEDHHDSDKESENHSEHSEVQDKELEHIKRK
jgi:flagellar biosynthesis/type III secretory pathway M-ring protein FliF/YscJ